MKLSGPLIVVEDMNRSRKFYEDVLGLKMVMDLDGNMVFDTGHSIQEKKYWKGFLGIEEEDLCYENNVFELYFEEDNFEKFISHLETFEDINYVNPVKEYPWGQSVVRFRDPDGHIVEVGQTMESVSKGFEVQGMTPEEIAKRMGCALDYVLEWLK